MIRPPPKSPPFPSPTLFQSHDPAARLPVFRLKSIGVHREFGDRLKRWSVIGDLGRIRRAVGGHGNTIERSFPGSRLPTAKRKDRKSTRLNSSHLVISYAVFC